MEILKKDILKEMEEKSQENLDKGINMAVSILKNEFPFVTGWKYKHDPDFFNSTVYIILICDMDKSSEFYNSPIKDYYRNLEADVTYPFSPLEMSIEMDNEEKYELYKEIQKSLDETYYEIPNDYRHTFKSYVSDTDQPKEINIDGFVFPAPEKLSEAFDVDYYRSKYGPPEEEPNIDIENMTKEEVKEWGSQYFSQKFFRLFSPKTYNYAKKKRWLHDICHELEWDECGDNNKKIYGFFFEKEGQKYVYVGITNNITKRFSNHTDLAKTKLSHFQRMVKEMEVDPKDIDFRVLFWKFLDDYRSGQIERSLISYFKAQPEYICLNVAPGGSTGEKGKTTKIVNYVADIIAKEKIENEEDFKKLYPKEYDFLKGTNKLKLINKVFNYRFFDQGHYTNDEIFNSAKKYLNKKDFQKNEPRAFGAAFRRNMLDDLFPENINESESSNDKVSLAKSLIQQLFDEVSFIEQSTYNDRPLLTVYFDSDDTAANIESVFTHEICDTVKDYTSGEIKCNPSWGPKMRTLRNNPDILIDAILLEYDDEGNVLNENKLDEIERNIEVINLILNEISWNGLCEIWVEYNEDDKEYEIRSKSKLQDELSPLDEIQKELDFLDDSIRSMGIRPYIFTPWYVDECEDEVKFLNESEEETNYIPIIEEIIEPFKNEDCVCEINAWYDEEDDMYSVYLVLGTEELNGKFYYVDGIRTYRNKLARKIETEIKSYLPIDNLYVGSYGKPNCGWKPLNENWFKVPSSDYNSLEKIINLTMKEKYGWWKDIKINTLNYIDLYGDVQIEAELTVDEEWGANQWGEFYYNTKFPGNEGWEDGWGDRRRVSLGDITDSTYAEVIRDDLREIFKYALNIESYNMSFRNVYLIFE